MGAHGPVLSQPLLGVSRSKMSTSRYVSALALAAALACDMGNASAEEFRQSVSIGPAWTGINLDLGYGTKLDGMSGISVQYKLENRDTPVGLVVTYTHTSSSDDASMRYQESGLVADVSIGAKLTYNALTAGPSFRFNKYLTGYLQAGIAKGEGRGKVRGQVTDGVDTAVVSGKVKADDTAPVAGFGMHIQPTRHIFIRASYDYAAGDLKSDTFSVGLGYMF